MTGLVEFLHARLDEDERTAKAVQWDGSGNALSWELPFSATVQVGSEVFSAEDSTIAQHISRHDPARVLAEVEAKRQIVKAHARLLVGEFCQTCDAPSGIPGQPYGCATLRLLALPYADRPGYRDEWRP